MLNCILRYPKVSKGVRVADVKKIHENQHLADLLKSFIESHKAGSPTDPTVFWIHLRPKEIAKLFFKQHQESVSHGSIKRLLKELGYPANPDLKSGLNPLAFATRSATKK